MRSNPMQRNFGSALKHTPPGAGLHGHKGKDGKMTYHEKSRNTGKTSSYTAKKGDDGVEVLEKNPHSNFGRE